METKFLAVGSIKIDERRYAIYGRILTGEIGTGLYAKIPLGSESELTLQIDSVEYMDRIREKVSYEAIVFNKLDPTLIEMIETADIANKTLEISATTELMESEVVGWYEPADPTPRCQCPCCDYISLPERNNYLICPVCYWEDDGQDIDQLDETSSPNHGMTLREARANFLTLGACDFKMLKHVLAVGERSQFEHQPRTAE